MCLSRLPDVKIHVGVSQVDVQLKKRKVGVAIVGLLLALVLDVLLEDGGGLWVVSVESVEDGLDVLWALWRIVEWNTHDCNLRSIEGEGQELVWSCGDVVNGGWMAVVAEKISSFTIRAADVLFRGQVPPNFSRATPS